MATRLAALRAADYRTTPWKNGGGTTREIAVAPAQGPYAWRLSVADIAASGPFSTFAGYDRVIVQLEGGAMSLTHPGRGSQELAPLVPYRFAGDWETSCELKGPPARDFNVMTRRGDVVAHVESLTLAGGAAPLCRASVGMTAVYCVGGEVTVGAGAEPAVRLAAGDTALAEAPPGETLRVEGQGAVLLVRLGARS
jgi:environmental stress-induced protein Ves